MKRNDVKEKMFEMLNQSHNHIQTKLEQALNSGAIDLEDYENNYRLPKIILHVLLKELASQYKPHTAEDRKTAKNLERFV